MKKIFAIAAIAALALTSCVKNEDAFVLKSQNEISFRSYSLNVAKDTRATEFATTAPDFGVFALYHEAGEAWAAADQTTAEYYISNSNVSFDGTDGIWKPAAKYYWPTKGSLSFVAYSPYQATATFDKATNTMVVPVGAITSSTAASSDFMYSSATINKAAATANDSEYVNGGLSAKGVNLLFKHAGAKVLFKAKLAKEIATAGTTGIGATIKIKKIDVKTVVKSAAAGTLSVVYDALGVPTATLSALTTPATGDFTVFNVTPGTEVNSTTTPTALLGDALYVIPQALGTVVVDVTYSIQNGDLTSTLEDVIKTDIVLTSSDNKWNAGTQYTYTMKLAEDLQEVWFDPEEEEWNSAANEDIDINAQ